MLRSRIHQGISRCRNSSHRMTRGEITVYMCLLYFMWAVDALMCLCLMLGNAITKPSLCCGVALRIASHHQNLWAPLVLRELSKSCDDRNKGEFSCNDAGCCCCISGNPAGICETWYYELVRVQDLEELKRTTRKYNIIGTATTTNIAHRLTGVAQERHWSCGHICRVRYVLCVCSV